ncbi:hypothetical protein BH23ACT5_BH23ACT5_05740 [soil metagenome]
MGIHLPAQAREAILAHAISCLPNEACGLIATDGASIRMIYSLDNADRSPSTFTVEPAQHFGALLHAERHGWEIGGIFHSHPSGPAVPSRSDRSQPHDTSWIHVVVGFVPRPHVRAWRFLHGDAVEVPIDQSLAAAAEDL